mgnify:CR=1 FL=1
MKDLEVAETRNISLQKENERLIQENTIVHRRFEEYKDICEKERKELQKTEIFSEHLTQKDEEIDRLYVRIQSLEEEASGFLRQLG